MKFIEALSHLFKIRSVQPAWLFCFVLLLLSLFPSIGYAQRTDIPLTGEQEGYTATPDSTVFSGRQESTDKDTFGIYYLYAHRPWEITFKGDTLLDDFQQYDPVRQRDLELAHLGNLGSATNFLVYEPRHRKGFDVGLHQYDIYHTTAETLPFYLIETPFTIINYTRGAEQADSYFTAKFARNFAKGLSFTFDYKRISQLGERNQYLNQNNRNTALAGGIGYQADNGKYSSFLSYAANTIENKDNGGIAVESGRDTMWGFLYTITPSAAEVILSDAQTRHAHREWSYTQYYRLAGKPDSVKTNRRTFSLAHQFLYNDTYYKFFDTYNPTDTSYFYKWFPELETDDRGMRFYLKHKYLRNSIRLMTYKKSGAPSQGKVAANKDFFEAGIAHTWHKVQQEGARDTILNDILIHGKLDFQPSEKLWLKTYAHLGLGNNAGDYLLNGELFFDLGKAGALSVSATNQLYRPDYLQHQYFLTQQRIWQNDFKRTLETNIQAKYLIPILKVQATGAYHLINNYIYFDTLAMAQQTGVPISITQLILSRNLKLGVFHLNNTVAFQAASENFIRLPGIYGKHSLYYDDTWFKEKLGIRIGFDLRYNDTFDGYYYNPATGRFQLEDRQTINFFPNVDFWLTIKITKFRGFLKYENLSTMLSNDQLYYTTAFQPSGRPFLRLGFSWKLLN
jgi:hypothetical protein